MALTHAHASLHMADVMLDHTLSPGMREQALALILMNLGATAGEAVRTVRRMNADGVAFVKADEPGITEALYRGRYGVRAWLRSRGEDAEQPQEARYYAAHQKAKDLRERAERLSKTLAAWHGNVLGHYGISDEATTPDCRFLIGKNFRVDDPPDGLYPGARHLNCRCTPGPPIPGAVTV